jgi:flagellar biosynthetic protein FliQ
MNESSLISIASSALFVGMQLAGPALAVSLIVGLLVSLFQTLTQLQESTLTFLPKLLAIAGVIYFTAHWMISQLTTFTISLFGEIPKLLGGG